MTIGRGEPLQVAPAQQAQPVPAGDGSITPADDGAFTDAWRGVRDNPDLQFSPVELPEQAPPPDWWLRFLEWLGEVLGPVAQAFVAAWPVIKWVLLAALVAAILFAIYRLVDPASLRRREKRQVEEEWVPEQKAALALLEEADRLADEGRFDEATHLLLMRSVGQIAEARPDLVDPSSTAREIAAEPELGDTARGAFSVIAERVERSLFALRSLSAEDWQAARAAYADFAQVRPGAPA